MDPFLFEDNLQNVCFTGLTSRGIPHGTTRGTAENAQDRVEVVVSGFAEASERMALSNTGVWFRNHYTGTLAFGVFTQRGGANAANHNVWVSNIRAMMSRPAQFFTANTLPCYEVLRVSETASDPEVEVKTDADHTPLTYLVELGIVGSQVS
jgi:hypothetical protein